MKRILTKAEAVILKAAALALALSLAAPAAFAASSNWSGYWSKKKARRSNQRHTTVAAVRGVDEPGEVDPEARNYEAVAKMEARTYAADKVGQFAKDGKLVRVPVQAPAPEVQK